MPQLIIDFFFGVFSASIGAAGAVWICWRYFQRRQRPKSEPVVEARYAADILVRLQELAARVAMDVDEHSSRVEEINTRLVEPKNQKPDIIVDVVAKLIDTNNQMQRKLASTEDKLRQQAQKMEIQATEARTDSLTMLANRRAFDDEISRRMAEFRRLKQPFSLIMADVDHFKQFNDSHGHQTGDEVLQAVAKMLRRIMREMDFVTRFGGEEFAIILPGTILQNAAKAALRACKGIDAFRFSNNSENTFHLTLSFGVAESLADEDETVMIARADKALYASKHDGRNCVYLHDGQNTQRVDPIEKAAASVPESQHTPEPAAKKEKAKESKAATPPPAENSESADEAELDVLANLSSRTNFCQQVRTRAAEWKRGGPTFSLVLIEVNLSKQDSEQFDMSIREYATQICTNFLLSIVREMDFLGHYAPGCFALLLPSAGIADAIRVAERIREGFIQYCLAKKQNKTIELTLSIGVAQIMDGDESLSLLKRAETALDVADRHGGNQTFYHDGTRSAPITAMLETMNYLT
ncbi:MAG: GGDEF domain-containing protein [Thermoguttaceae bacterium]